MLGRSLAPFMLLAIAASCEAVAETTTFVCNYTKYADEDGVQKVDEDFRLTFLIDGQTQKAYMLGNNGSTEVSLILNSSGLTFVEITGTGNVMVTAIDQQRKTVHSRSSIILGELVPSQYYGTCTTK